MSKQTSENYILSCLIALSCLYGSVAALQEIEDLLKCIAYKKKFGKEYEIKLNWFEVFQYMFGIHHMFDYTTVSSNGQVKTSRILASQSYL